MGTTYPMNLFNGENKLGRKKMREIQQSSV